MPLTISKNGGIRSANTTIVDTGEAVTVTLYATPIFVYDRKAGTVTLRTGGHHTPTTFRRMNECIAHYFPNWGLRVGKDDFRKFDHLIYPTKGNLW